MHLRVLPIFWLAALFAWTPAISTAAPAIAVAGGIQPGNSVQPLLFTWNSAIPIQGAGWAPGETVSIVLQGPLNSLGVSPSSVQLGNANAGGDGAFSSSFAIPYDGGVTGPQANIPRPGLYRVVGAGSASGSATASYAINLCPATYTGPGGQGIDWSHERGTRIGVLPGALSMYSPERTDPAWISVWDNIPVGVYGTVAESASDGANQPARISFEDAPSNHYAHDTNMYLVPDPDYRWTVGTANYYFNGEDVAAIALGRDEIEWEVQNDGNANSYGKGSIGLPIWAMPTSGDRLYVVGRWVLDAGHPELGDRTEIHPPRLVAVVRQRPTASISGTAAMQVDIYVSGHGGAANHYPSGMDALLDQGGRGGGRLRDVLSAADQQTYYQAGPIPFLQVALFDLLVQQLAGVALTGPVKAVAGPSAFTWGSPAPEQQPINDMDYDFDVPLPAPPDGATSVNIEAITHAEHSTAVTESVTYPASTNNGLPTIAHIHLPYHGADSGIYAKTLKFSWNVAGVPQHHFRVRLDRVTVKALPGKWQLWSDLSGQWTYLPSVAPALLQSSQGQVIPITGVQSDIYLGAGDTLRILVQGYRANCIDTLFATQFGMSSYAAGIQLLENCGPVNNDDLGGALLELPALPSSQGTYTVTADPGSQPGVAAFEIALTVDYMSPVQTPSECQGRSPLSPVVASGGVVGAGLSNPPVAQIAPGGLISIFGQAFAPPGVVRGVTDADLRSGQLPDNLGCTCVAVNHHLAPLLFVSPTQINIQTPELPGSGKVAVQVVANCEATSQSTTKEQTVAVQAASPEFFFFTHNANGPSPVAAANAVTGALIGANGLLPGLIFTPAKPGDLVALYATGLGPTEPAFTSGALAKQIASTVSPVLISLNGAPLAASDVLYAGVAPGFAGLYQINIRIPGNAPAGDAPISLSVDGVSTPAGAFITISK